MPKRIPPEVETLVFAFSKFGLSRRKIQAKLKEQNHVISGQTVSNILQSVGYRRNHKVVGLKSPKKEQPRTARTKELIKKIDQLTNKEHPPSQNAIAKQLNVSKLVTSTVGRVIREDLGATVRKKRRVHVLKPSHKKNRKTNSRKLYEQHLAGDKIEFCVTIDEAWFYLQDCEGARRIY